MIVPAISLQHSVPVDADHVSALMENIKTNGQLAPIIVRRLTHEIIDGFHRVSALQLLGMDAEIVERELTDEEFLAARIVSATQHEEVKVGRAVTWIDEEWANLPFAKQHKSAAAAFSAAGKGKASSEVAAWVEKQSNRWGAATSYIRSHWLYEHKESSQPCDPPEVPTVVKSTVKGDKPLTDPESMPPKLRNVWADAKVFVAEAKKVSDGDFNSSPIEHQYLMRDAIEELLEEANRIHGYV